MDHLYNATAPDLPAFASILRWCAISGVGRSKTYELLGSGVLRAKKLGTRVLIDVPHGISVLNSLPDASIRRHGASRRE